jgi:hypothetical protein
MANLDTATVDKPRSNQFMPQQALEIFSIMYFYSWYLLVVPWTILMRHRSLDSGCRYLHRTVPCDPGLAANQTHVIALE